MRRVAGERECVRATGESARETVAERKQACARPGSAVRRLQGRAVALLTRTALFPSRGFERSTTAAYSMASGAHAHTHTRDKKRRARETTSESRVPIQILCERERERDNSNE